MKERPILFSSPMVRAILEGRKTVTRRLVNPQPPEETPHFRGVIGSYSGAVRPYFFWGRFEDWNARNAFLENPHHDPYLEENILWPGGDSDGFTCDMYAAESGLLCPFGAAANDFRRQGDRLWVRETWAHVPSTAYRCSDGVQQLKDPTSDGMAAVYRADWTRSSPGRWRPSIHMPRWASRITLEITGVRVERLQDINEADVLREGIRELPLQEHEPGAWWCADPLGNQTLHFRTPRAAFCNLWESINGPDSWNANPWVWVIEFKRMETAP